MSGQLEEILYNFLVMSIFLLLIFYVIINKQFNFFILLRKFLGIDQLICDQERILRPNLIKNNIATFSSK